MVKEEVFEEIPRERSIVEPTRRRHRRRSPSSSSSSSRSRSRSPYYSSSRKHPRRHRSRRRHSRTRSRSRSLSYYRRTRYFGSRENPHESRVIGVFGLSSRTNETKLLEVFSHYGAIERIHIVNDAKTGNSRGFGFIYFAQIDEASAARNAYNGATLDGKRIRVDYSITKRPHTPTPGQQSHLCFSLF